MYSSGQSVHLHLEYQSMSQVPVSSNVVALVTGGSRGIGKAVAMRLAGQGLSVAINYRSSTAEADAIVQCIRDAGGRALAVQADMSDASQAAGLVARVESTLGPLTVLINNAGITRDRLVIQMSSEDWDATWTTDLAGTRALSRVALESMRRAGTGSIVNVSSVVGVIGNAGQANYAAAKSAVLGLTRDFAVRAACYNVRVNCVVPGYIVTDATAHLTEPQRRAWMTQIPMGRFATVDEVVGTIVFLAGAESSYLTGQCIAVDGGFLAAAGMGLES
jgi:3-oxoacyl-[acyl-carrier protein] reductase